MFSKNDLEDDFSLKLIIQSATDTQLIEHKDRLFKVLNMRNNQLFNNINDKLNTDDKTKNQR